ncbi:MAG TPA: GNAT family N-acetyltransferase [Candidatus Binatia bacterium]|nr:GNAT family N-acetyltransferase [Candidatus Binatia bacterium]
MAIVVEKYSARALEPVVTILAHAFVTNPLHVSAFGAHQIDQNRSLFRLGLRQMFCGKSVVALANGQIQGYAHFSPSPHCLPAPEILPGTMAPLLKPFGKASAPLMRWFVRWCHLDPEEPHLHLGPIGVAPQAQRQGVGTALMRCYLDHLRAENLPGYLETDKPENIEFYEKFGFVVEHEEELIGAPTWYMWREPE